MSRYELHGDTQDPKKPTPKILTLNSKPQHSKLLLPVLCHGKCLPKRHDFRDMLGVSVRFETCRGPPHGSGAGLDALLNAGKGFGVRV